MSTTNHHPDLPQFYIDFLRSSALPINNAEHSNAAQQMPPYQRLVAALLLRRTVDQLVITNRGRQNFALDDQLAAMKERFRQMRGGARMFDERTLEPVLVAMKRMQVVKLEDDIAHLQALLKDCSDELIVSGTFAKLCGHIERFRDDYRSEYSILCESIRNARDLRELREQYDRNAEAGRERLDEITDLTSGLKAEIDATEVDSQIKEKLVSKWEDARFEQAERILQQDETRLEQSIVHYGKLKDREQIAMAEIENCIGFKVQQLQRSCDEWAQRFATETANYDAQIRATSEEIADIEAKCTDLRRRGDEYQTHIDAYREHQRQMAERRRHEEMLCMRATCIQAWWRGVMVRHQLGPYRPKKKGKKGGKAKK